MNLSSIFTAFALILVAILAATCAAAQTTATPINGNKVENDNAAAIDLGSFPVIEHYSVQSSEKLGKLLPGDLQPGLNTLLEQIQVNVLENRTWTGLPCLAALR